MFTGIVEAMGRVSNVETEGTNRHITIETALAGEAYIDQSIAHNGICLTVVSLTAESYVVTAIKETLDRSNLADWKVGDQINLERAMLADMRLDGHMVQGHVDGTTEVLSVVEEAGSWVYSFALRAEDRLLIVDKGSICVNGISLTVVNPTDSQFSVAIIPYTYEHTNMQHLQPGDRVNLEFDILGKYVSKYLQRMKDVG